jgi:hypothetical protein
VFTMDSLKGTGGLGFPIHTRLMPGLVIWTVSSDQRSAPLQVRKKMHIKLALCSSHRLPITWCLHRQ